MLTSWNHDFNLYLIAQFAFLYTKEWSTETLDEVLENFLSNSISTTRTFWTNHPKFEFVPNINFDMGMKYDYHCSNGVAIEFAAGYHISAYWELEELSRTTSFSGGDDAVIIVDGFLNLEKTFSFSGPYVRFAVFH